MLNRESPKTLSAQLEEEVRGNLASGRWPAGSAIPSENELSRIYGISRMTARNVITKFVQEESLLRIPGKGTFVAEPKIEAKSLSYAGIREQLEQMGYEVTTQMLGITRKKGTPRLCERFGLPQDSRFYVLRRLRFIKGEPLSIHTSYIPVAYCPHLEKQELSGEQLCHVLSRSYGLNRSHTRETLESVAARRDEAKLLDIPEGHPLLLLHDTIRDESGRTFEYASVLFRGEKIKLTLDF